MHSGRIYTQEVDIFVRVVIRCAYVLQCTVSEKCPRVFSDFAGNLRTRKMNKAQIKRANVTGVSYFCAYKQVVSTSYFIPYPLLILLPHYLHQLPFSPPPPPPTEFATPLTRVGIRKIKIASPLTLTRPSPPLRRIYRHA